jgi:uncharacterized peroxidase-related enzyme
LRRAGGDESLAERLKDGWQSAGLDDRAAAIAAWAEKSTREPSSMTEDDLAPLRAAGLSDEDLLVLAHAVALFNDANRLAEGLHVDPEPA